MHEDACISLNKQVEMYGKIHTRHGFARDRKMGWERGRGADDKLFFNIFVLLHYFQAYIKVVN